MAASGIRLWPTLRCLDDFDTPVVGIYDRDHHQGTCAVRHPMSALGQKQTYAVHQPMSALPPKVDIHGRQLDVRMLVYAGCPVSKHVQALRGATGQSQCGF